MEYDFNEYNYDMVSVQAHVLNINLCKEVTGGLFYIYLLYTYYRYKCINLFSSEVGAKKGVFTSIHPGPSIPLFWRPLLYFYAILLDL